MDYAQRRVHPSDVEAAMETAPAYPSKYVMLNNNNSSSVRPPPQRRNIPRYHSNNHNSRGHCCLKCVCCCFCFSIVVIIVLASLLGVLYVTLDPKMPQYNIESFEVNAFNMAPDFSLYTEFVVVVKANNPNKEIAFTYGKDSSVVVAYSDSTLCSGKIPAFHQPFENTTMIRVVLTGKSEFGSGLQEALMDNRETGRIPLLVIVKAPISVMVKSLALRQVMVNVNCSLVVDNLAPNKRVRILSSTYTYAFEGITLKI
nr:NDR1/HIN1-like protein 6 [Populus alba]